MSLLNGKEILLGVTGGIACYKAVEVLRGLKKAGAGVQVVMTRHSTEFVAPLTFQTLSNRPVGTDLFELDRESKIGHIAMARRADLVLVAPCTANVLAKLRAGIADDLLSTLLLATTAPVFLALAMNDNMLAHPATRDNLAVLEGRGTHIIPPEVGFLAEGSEGPGRLADPETVVATVTAHLTGKQMTPPAPLGRAPGPLAGRRVLVTAGPTVEPIDPARFLSNHSSGRMGFAVAEVCREAGAQVTLVRGPVHLPDPHGMKVVGVSTGEEMAAAVRDLQPKQDVLVFAAAVADYRMRKTEPQKIKRAGKTELTLTLEANPDVAAEAGKRKTPGQVIVIFAAESQELMANATKKLEAKQADLVVANDITLPGAGFESTQNRVTLVGRGVDADGDPNILDLPLMEKHAVAGHLVDRIAALLAQQN